MPEKLSKLGISQETIDASIEHSDLFENNIPSFVKEIFGRIRTEQPELFVFMCESAQHLNGENLLAYGLGASLTYDMLPQSRTQKSLTASGINAVSQTFAEYVVFEEQEGERKGTIELSWFIDKLMDDSPVFVDWLAENLNAIQGMEKKKNFLKGAMHVSVPFYMREEAEEMEQVLFGER